MQVFVELHWKWSSAHWNSPAKHATNRNKYIYNELSKSCIRYITDVNHDGMAVLHRTCAHAFGYFCLSKCLSDRKKLLYNHRQSITADRRLNAIVIPSDDTNLHWTQDCATYCSRCWYSCPYIDHKDHSQDALPRSDQHVYHENTSPRNPNFCIQTQNLDTISHFLGNLHKALTTLTAYKMCYNKRLIRVHYKHANIQYIPCIWSNLHLFFRDCGLLVGTPSTLSSPKNSGLE